MSNPFNYVKKIKNELNDKYWRAKLRYIKYIDTMAVDEKAILLESQHGVSLGNCYYMAKYMAGDKKYKDYKIYFCARGKFLEEFKNIFSEYPNVKIVTLSDDDYFIALATSKYLVNDNTFLPFFVKRKEQIYINTWHGTPLKTLGKCILDDAAAIGNAQKNLISADYLLFPNKFTRDVMVRDYMLENISSGSTVLGGYPRNEIFFDIDKRNKIRKALGLEDKKIYAYMPTWRGTVGDVGSLKADSYLLYHLCEIDKLLADDEILFVNLHPMNFQKKPLNFKMFTHLQPFPKQYETYEFLNTADCLITDYSSVFFDFACSQQKIVLFPYDKDEYLADRGLYFPMEELPFPQCFTDTELIDELRRPKNYDDSEFRNKFCNYDNINASKQICDFVILGEENELKAEKIPDNGKENVILYAGNLDQNGITTSIRNLLNSIDLDKRNYYVSFCQARAKKNSRQLATFNQKSFYLSVAENFNLALSDKVPDKLFSDRVINTDSYMKKLKHRFEQYTVQAFGTARIDKAIQFSGYENDMILLYSALDVPKYIFVHNDMENEIKTRNNQRRDLLKYAYNSYDKVACVSDDIIEPTERISGKKDNIVIVNNTIDYKTVLEKAEKPITLDQNTRCSVSEEKFYELINSDAPKFINIARYSPEKGHERLVDAFYEFHKEHSDALLFIMGGNQRNEGFDLLCKKIEGMGLSENVILLLSVSNPYPILKACDYFVLSSFYEGFGLVLAEADILGKPVTTTDINGPRSFMKKYGGTIVENSQQGLLCGLKKLYSGEIKHMNVDYEAYNKNCVEQFEKLFE